MEKTENVYKQLWSDYLKTNYYCSLRKFCAMNHDYYAGMETWVYR